MKHVTDKRHRTTWNVIVETDPGMEIILPYLESGGEACFCDEEGKMVLMAAIENGDGTETIERLLDINIRDYTGRIHGLRGTEVA